MENTGIGITFSICVLTFNRGDKALNVAKNLLDDLESNWELLFLDNGSYNETDSYQLLARMAENDNRLKYVRHESNRGFHGNFLASFDLATGPYMMVMSDEDFANPEMIRNVLPLLYSYPNVGIMRGSIEPVDGVEPKNSHLRTDASYFQGEEALSAFAFSNNYISGTIYNRNLFKDLGLVERLRNEIERNSIYPHLYLDLLAAAVSDVVTTSQICCFEGASQILNDNVPNRYAQPYSFGSRIDQFVILRDAVWEAVELVREPFDKALFAAMYLRLCEKYMYLITRVNSPMYLQHKIHPGLLHQAMLYVCGAAISMYPEIAEFEAHMFEEIQKLHGKYEPYQ